MAVGFVLFFWPLFIASTEVVSIVLWRRPSGAMTIYLWLVPPTAVLAVTDVYVRGSLKRRFRQVGVGAGIALAVGLLLLVPWGHIDLLVCEWKDNCLSVEQWNALKGTFSDNFAVLLWLIAAIDALGCMAWSMVLAHVWLRYLRADPSAGSFPPCGPQKD